MRGPGLLLCLSLGIWLGLGSWAPRVGRAATPVLYVPPESQLPQSEPPPLGEKAVDGPGLPKARRLRVTIAPLPSAGVSEAAKVALQRELGDALRRNSHLEMKDLDVRLADFAQEIPSDQVDFARESYQKGKDALYKLEVDKAVAELADAVDQLVAVLPYVKKQELADALMALAVAQMHKGKLTAMQQTLRRLLIWRPTYQPDASVPPQMSDPLEAARQAVNQLAQGQLTIRSEPPGAQVFVDGDYIGVAPTSISGLPVGEHYVTFKRLGYKRGLRIAQVTPSGVQVVGKLERAEKYLLVEQALSRTAPQMGKSPLDPVVDNLRETLFLDHMVFMQVQKSADREEELALHTYLYDLRTRQLLSHKEVSVRLTAGSAPQPGSLDGLASSLYAGVDYTGGLRQPIDAPPPPVAESQPLYKRWWFWTAVGVIVAGGASALAVGLATRPPSCPSGHVCTGAITYALTF